MIAYIIYVLFMFTWIASLKNKVCQLYKEKEGNFISQLINYFTMGLLEIIEFLTIIIIWFLWTGEKI